MYTDVFTQLGLAKNEARIYETLLTEGEIGVGEISTKSKVHRRNVYDSLNRLIEKGLVFEIRGPKENHYKPVNPNKFSEMLAEKEHALAKIMPQLQARYTGRPHANEVYIYRGIEGWKNYLNDMLRVGQPIYTLGAKGTLSNPKLKTDFEQFVIDAKAKKIEFRLLCDNSLLHNREFLALFDKNYRFLPKKYETGSTIDIFGDHVVIFSGLEGINFDEEASFTVIINKQIADSLRTWFQLIWVASDQIPAHRETLPDRQIYPSFDFIN
jgi:predicted transcriptional regulator